MGCVSHLCEDADVRARACVSCGPWAQAENKDLKDKVLYTLAEMENVRTIARRYDLHPPEPTESDCYATTQRVVHNLTASCVTVWCRDMEQSRQFAIQSFAKQLLDVADNLGRAVESIPPAELEKQADNKLLATLLEGVRMTDTQLQKVFQANKIIRVRHLGQGRRIFQMNYMWLA